MQAAEQQGLDAWQAGRLCPKASSSCLTLDPTASSVPSPSFFKGPKRCHGCRCSCFGQNWCQTDTLTETSLILSKSLMQRLRKKSGTRSSSTNHICMRRTALTSRRGSTVCCSRLCVECCVWSAANAHHSPENQVDHSSQPQEVVDIAVHA